MDFDVYKCGEVVVNVLKRMVELDIVLEIVYV